MKIHLNQREIEDALLIYIEKEGINLEGKKVIIEMATGRNPPSHHANINIIPLTNEDEDEDEDMISESGENFTNPEEDDDGPFNFAMDTDEDSILEDL